MIPSRRALAPLLAAWWVTLPLVGQDTIGAPALPAPFVPGALIERVVSAADSTQQFALFLPSRYRTDRRWPILFLMDPRGRALLPMRLIQEAADRHGYIIMSSYNTLSDGAAQPNVDAMNAMLADAQQYFAIDTRRLYLVGFSGTARVGWDFGFRLRGHVAGLIGFGAGLPVGFTLTRTAPGQSPPFSFFGGSGTTDFNYEEMQALEQTLARFDLPHRFEYYDGPHGWPPAKVMRDAVDWMDLQAMKLGLALPDSAWIDSAFVRDLAEASALEVSRDFYPAYQRYRAIVEDFAGLHDVTVPQGKVAELADSKVVQRITTQLETIMTRHDSFVLRLGAFLEQFKTAPEPPTLEESLRRLRIKELEDRAASTKDSIDALAAQRLLERVFVFTSFYEPRDYFEKGDAARALAILALAQQIKPGDPRVCYNRARALVQLGRHPEALAALECLVAAGWTDADRLAGDPNLDALRDDPGFGALLERLRAKPEPR